MLNEQKINELQSKVLRLLLQGPKGYAEIAEALLLDKINDVRQLDEYYTAMGWVQDGVPYNKNLGRTIMLTSKGRSRIGM